MPPEHVFDLSQFVLGPDSEYEQLKLILQSNVDEVASWPEYTPQMEQFIQGIYGDIRKTEMGLLAGIKRILENMPHVLLWEPCYWYGKIVRQEIIFKLWSSQRSASAEISSYGKDFYFPLDGAENAARFFEVNDVERVQCCLHADSSRYFGAWIDGASESWRFLREWMGMLQPLKAACSTDVIAKFLVPQMLYSNLRNPEDPVTFNFGDFKIGVA